MKLRDNPMNRPPLQTFNDLERWLNEKRITEIECLVPDLTGVARGKILPRNKFTQERGMRLPEAIVGLTVTGNWPDDTSGIDELISNVDHDMNLLPDPATVRMVPWGGGPPAQGCCTTAISRTARRWTTRRVKC
jgi:glutamine synthetase